jgi:preprotein translocase SecE subunit
VARNRQRARPSRPPQRRGAPLPASAGGAGQPPVEEDPVAFDDGDDDAAPREEQVSTPAAAFGAPEAAPSRRGPNIFRRTVSFLEGCWAELKRVQWPDRPQVVQATGVVLGFVALTGVFLGVADLVAGKLVNAIL